MRSSHKNKVAAETCRAIAYALLLWFLGACQSPPYRPPSDHTVQDQWRVIVGRDGLVEITRNVILSQPVADYVRDASALEAVLLFGEIDGEERNSCELPQGHGNALVLNCIVAYRIQAMPTQLRATLPFPHDLLPGFLIDSLAYQPLGLSVMQEVDITVPGQVHVPSKKRVSLSLVHASRSIKAASKDPCCLRIQSELILAPGDLVQPYMQHLDPIVFDPIFNLDLE